MNQQIFKQAKRRDQIARYLIIGSGGSVMICVIGIFFIITWVALPLFQAPRQEMVSQFSLGSTSETVIALAIDEYLEIGATLDPKGQWTFYQLNDGQVMLEKQLTSPHQKTASIIKVDEHNRFRYSLLWSDGSISIVQVKFTPRFTSQGRMMTLDVKELAHSILNSTELPIHAQARVFSVEDGESRITFARLFDNNKIEVAQEIKTRNLFGNEKTEVYEITLHNQASGKITEIVLGDKGNFIYAGTDSGRLLRWSLEEPGEGELLDHIKAINNNKAITSMTMVFGNESLVIGDEIGNVSTWFPIPLSQGGSHKKLTKIHQLKKHPVSIRQVQPSLSDKSIISLNQVGVIHWDHMTSERHLLRFKQEHPLKYFKSSGRGNGLIAVDDHNNMFVWKVDNPHPEISWSTMLQEVLYEGYPQPDYVWQSSSASDDFEAKFSLIPLVFGSFKGTVYAMIFAIPLALLGAIYVSQFAEERFRKVVKPSVEIMAAMPSVIIGFLIALWLAPIVEAYVISFFLSLILIPVVGMFFLIIWFLFRNNSLARLIERGYEFWLTIPIILIACVLSFSLQGTVETLFFNGNFQLWLFQEVGTRYDQRNSVIIAFGLGFMVIPIIFTMSDDALNSVPENLKAASLALGASRWQTVWKVVIPSASPGIFAAFIIGFGRAVGETMVVLMATGNTPILDWSIFNGMRTLSANIAVELPEAPVDSTLYRILFLSAVILFLLTSVLNTFAELIRQRLRKKYGQFQ